LIAARWAFGPPPTPIFSSFVFLPLAFFFVSRQVPALSEVYKHPAILRPWAPARNPLYFRQNRYLAISAKRPTMRFVLFE